MKFGYNSFRGLKRFAIMGGTFDPIHFGHLVTAEAVRCEFGLEKIIFLPSGHPPHKDNNSVSLNEHRYLMTVIATVANPYFEVSRLEIDRPGTTYTIDTIMEIRKLCDKDAQIYFITGADAVSDILKWKDYEKLLALCNFIAVTRPDHTREKLFENIKDINERYESRLHFLEVPALAISSTDIRNRVRMGKSIRYLLSEEVENYISKKRLYKGEGIDTEIEEIKRKIKVALSEKRYVHTLGVAGEAVKLAEYYGADMRKALVAGLLHDCAKELSESERKSKCKKYKLGLDDVMKNQQELIHSFLGAKLAQFEFRIEDKDILNAIKHHTTGRKKMHVLEKIIFIADLIEPNRELYEGLTRVRSLAYVDLDKAVLESLIVKTSFENTKSKQAHPISLDALEYYKEKVKKMEEIHE